MVGIRNINISNKELEYYKQWVETDQNKDIQQHIAEIIRQKLDILKKQEGKCEQRSIFLTKGKYKGSCYWKSNTQYYKVYLRDHTHSITYGFFSSLYSAENELKRLFENNEDQLWVEAKKQQKFYQVQHRLTTRPKLTDNTKNIKVICKCKGRIDFLFEKPFTNPLNNKQQKQISWSKFWFKSFSKKQILDTCVKLDNPVDIIWYREDLRQRLKEAKGKNNNQ